MNSQADFSPLGADGQSSDCSSALGYVRISLQGAYGDLGQSSDCSSGDVVYAHGVPVQNTPSCNTGYTVTSRSRVVLDYLRFTVPAELADGLCCGELLALLRLDALPLVVEARRGGFLGWRCSSSVGPGAVIAWGGNRETACVDLPAGALGYLAAVGLDVWAWVSFMLDLGCRATRVDVALDDEDRRITPERVRAADACGGLVTRSQVSHEYAQRRGGRGWTYYVGVRSSPVFVRIYDKSAEQGLPEQCSWMRLEVEYKARKAQAVLRHWREAGYSVAFALAIIRDAIDFRVPSATDSNVSRWAPCDWWADLIGDVPALRLVVGAVERTIEKVAGWLHRSVAGALAAFHAVYGDESLRHLLTHGYDIMSGDHERLVGLALAS